MMNYHQLAAIRQSRKLSQTQVAEALGIKQQQYSRYETGEQIMSVEKYIKLAEYYNLSIDYLVGIISLPKPLH